MNHDRQSISARWPTYLTRLLLVGFVLLVTATASAQTVDSATNNSPTPDDSVRNKAVVVGTAIIAVIAVAGLAMICLVAVWGRRLRKVVRQPLPNQSRGDELWYLKPKKQAVIEKADEFDDGDTTPE